MNRICYAVLALLVIGCNKPQPVGKRVFTAKNNVSFILPDSTLLHSKWKMFGPDYRGSNYGESHDFYHNSDSTVRMTVYVEAIPESNGNWPVKKEFDRHSWMQKDPSLTIEKVMYDSIARTREMDGHTFRRGRTFYTRSLFLYGLQRRFQFWFLAPDTKDERRAIEETCSSIRVDANFRDARVSINPAVE